jgi:tRNA dimethylallyltransferase
MAPRSDDTPLIVILGTTGSGKTALGLDLALAFNGEIIAADSRTVYKGMDISTAKPSPMERRRVPHYLIDIVSPNQSFTVADFKRQAGTAIGKIASRGKVPFVVGGSGLYIDALLYDFTLRPTLIDPSLRNELYAKSVDELRQYILDDGLQLPTDSKNPRRLVRTIEAGGATSQRTRLRPNTLLLGLYADRTILAQRIAARVDGMVDAGLVDELRELASNYGWEAPALQTPGCKAFRKFLQGAVDLNEAKASFVRNDMNLARRQYTWFKRNKEVHWITSKESAVELVTTSLNKY